MFRIKDEQILSFLPDYKINLIAPADMTKEESNKMNTELREVLMFIKYSKDKEKLYALVNEDSSFKHMDRKAAQVIQAVTNLNVELDETEGEVNMCVAVDEMCQDARNEGIQIGIQKNIRNVTKNLLQKKLSDTLIMEVTGISEDELLKIKEEAF